MIKGTFTYALLQYHHSQILGEVLNIGLIAYFPDAKKIKFICPEKLIRLRFAYPNVPEKTIKSYFKLFEERVNDLNLKPEIFAEYDINSSFINFLNKEFLPPDSSALQFGNLRKSVLYTDNLEIILNQLYNLYFSVFQHQENITKKIDESQLLKNYKKLFNEISVVDMNSENNKLSFDYEINPTKGNKLKFDIAWKGINNLHLVKPISFDLMKQETITNKAYRFYGQFMDLDSYALDKNIQFDVLLAKPNKKELFSAYDNAIRVLKKPESVKIIEFNDLKTYAEKTAETLNHN